MKLILTLERWNFLFHRNSKFLKEKKSILSWKKKKVGQFNLVYCERFSEADDFIKKEKLNVNQIVQLDEAWRWIQPTQ